MTPAMAEVVQEEKMTHVLGDCYCDDWAFAEDGDTHCEAPLMLQQVQERGIIAIFHMSKRGFREASLEALRELLEGTNKMNLRCISLTEMRRTQKKARKKRELPHVVVGRTITPYCRLRFQELSVCSPLICPLGVWQYESPSVNMFSRSYTSTAPNYDCSQTVTTSFSLAWQTINQEERIKVVALACC
jgi:hypothetical protein